ncbi:Yip1 family protein [Streptomyces sp. NPDC054956]
MTTTPAVVVAPPDDVGLRKVVINGKTGGKVRSLNELCKVLRGAGRTLEDGIEWRGGDSTVWPDRSWRRRATGIVMAAGLLGTAFVLVKIGAKDAVDALTFGGRMAGFALLAAGVVEAICVLATFDYWGRRKVAQSGPVLLLGVSVALVTALGLLVMHVLNQAYPWYVLIWVSLGLWSLWGLWMLVVRGRVWKRLHNPRRIAIGASISTLLVVTNLAYGSVYVPSVAHPLVESTAEFGTPSLDADGMKMFLRVRLHIKNAGQVPVYVLGSIYWIKVRLAKDPGDSYQVIKPDEFIEPPGRTLKPEEEYSVDVVAEINEPETLDHEAVRVETETYVIREDRLAMTTDYEGSAKWRSELRKEGKENDPPGPDDDYKRYQSGISQSSELLNVVRGRERVTVWWVYRKSDPHLYVDVSRPGEKKSFDPDVKHAADRYGLEFVRGSITETPFAELMKKAQAQRPSSP